MSTTIDTLSHPALEEIRKFGAHYDYDVSYLEALAEASPGAFEAFVQAMGLGRYRRKAPVDLLAIAKLVALRAEDCGPCTELNVKMAREAGVPEPVIRGALRRGEGLTPEQRDVYEYARAVAANSGMDPELLPRLQERYGHEVVAELAIAVVASRLYPTLKRGLGFDRSCSRVPSLSAFA